MSPRPERHDDEVYKLAFELFWPKIVKYIGSDSEDDKDAAWKVLNHNYEMDGYQLAKDFENADFDVDAEFVDICDNWSHHLYQAHQKILADWVIANNVLPKLKLGDKVSFDKNHGIKFKKPEILNDGTITNVNTKTGVYTVNSLSLGHVVPGSNGTGVVGIFIPFSDLDSANEP